MHRAEQERPGRTALEGLFETHYERIARYIAAKVGNAADGEELASDVFLRALEHVDSYRWRGVPMEAWLFRIAHNLVVDHLRRNAHRRTVPVEEASTVASAEDPVREALRTLDREELLRAMGSLTEGQREVVMLRFFGELTSAEAGAVMKRGDGAVRELQSSALKKLRRVLGGQEASQDPAAQGHRKR
ncbi:MAG: sigma-70 family RNA polymerase sigma factor [Chloroflexi bacterium]|nr:sigma-70 family RNA polymerase sigma factor [Chloroflexota bacterium]